MTKECQIQRWKSLFHQPKRIFSLALLNIIPLLFYGQNEEKSALPCSQIDSVKYDTINISKGVLIFALDFFIQVPRDTVILVKSYTLTDAEIQMKVCTKNFYDSAYVKFGRHKISRFLYTLLFVPPKIITLQDNVQNLKSEVPYLKYKGKPIRPRNSFQHIRLMKSSNPNHLMSMNS